MTLDPKGSSCQLDYSKAGAQGAEMSISLSWSNNNGLLKRLAGHGVLDLDLGCFYLQENGDKSLIDALQFAEDYGERDRVTRQGSYTDPPYIWHTGDDRGWGQRSVETLVVNTQGLDRIARIIVYAFVYDGQARWAEANGELRITLPGVDEVVITLDATGRERLCAIASIDVDPDAHTLTITNLSTFHPGHKECDDAYAWGFEYHHR